MFEILCNIAKELTFQNIIVVILLFVILTGIVIFSIKSVVTNLNRKYTNIVKNTSVRYKDVLSINSQFDFYDLDKKYTFFKLHKSKVQFDRFDHTKFLREQIEKDIDYFKWILKAAKKNNILMKQYQIELMNVSPFADKDTFYIKGIHYSKYRKTEEIVVSNAILHPVSEPRVIIKSSYVSPKGRNSYNDNRVFSYYELVWEYDIVCENIKKRETKEYQRKAMTNSLRYDIMKRDGFRCVLCGRTASDGVKLHVDHITPVSKGGKTIPDNLRTLCDACNFGKRDKYDKYGYN